MRLTLALLALIAVAATGHAEGRAPPGLIQAHRACPITGCKRHCGFGTWDCEGKCIPKHEACRVFAPKH